MIMRDRIKKILKEDNEFDWFRESNPASKEDIIEKMSGLRDFGYRGDAEKSSLTTAIYNLGLQKEQLEPLVKALYSFAELCYNGGIDIGQQEGHSEGYNEGYNQGLSEGYDDALDDCKYELKSEFEDKFEFKFEEGYNEGYAEGYEKGYNEGSEETYYKAFEEGRAYEAGIDMEDFERRESGFDPSEYYDEDQNDY